MNLLVIGFGGREHALCWKLGRSDSPNPTPSFVATLGQEIGAIFPGLKSWATILQSLRDECNSVVGVVPDPDNNRYH